MKDVDVMTFSLVPGTLKVLMNFQRLLSFSAHHGKPSFRVIFNSENFSKKFTISSFLDLQPNKSIGWFTKTILQRTFEKPG